MAEFSLQELACFDAVVSEGSFQAAADKLHRSHPTVHAAVKSLEQQLGLSLFDRRGYRVSLTEAGRSFHERAKVLLGEMKALRAHAQQLASGEESELCVVIGDLCPLPETLALLRRFFDGCPGTRLHLLFDAIAGPWERLFDGDADLILHHIDKSDPRFEFINFLEVGLVPVVTPGLLRFPIDASITPKRMRDYVQVIIRDTAQHSPPRNYFVIDGARSCTVADQFMKKQLIVGGMGWGHMPKFLVQSELDNARLLSIAGSHFKESTIELVAARRRDLPHGPIAEKLWRFIRDEVS